MLTLALLVRWSVITAALIVVLIGAAGESSVALWLYVGLWSAFILVALGSWLSLLPNLVGIGALVWRTVFEDRLLTEEPESYGAYAEQVRSRLLRGVW